MDIDLFSQQKNDPQEKTVVSSSFLAYIKAFEKAILLVIGFIICGIVAFSLGVEKGKQSPLNHEGEITTALAPIKQQAVITTNSNPQQKAVVEPLQQQAVKPAVTETTKAKSVAGNYTVQIGSFQNKENAQREALKLRSKGLPTLLIPKGKLTILCVGNYTSKEKAEALLTKLKNLYKGSMIRRL